VARRSAEAARQVLVGYSKLVGLESRDHLRRAAVAGERVPLPHEIAASAQT